MRGGASLKWPAELVGPRRRKEESLGLKRILSHQANWVSRVAVLRGQGNSQAL